MLCKNFQHERPSHLSPSITYSHFSLPILPSFLLNPFRPMEWLSHWRQTLRCTPPADSHTLAEDDMKECRNYTENVIIHLKSRRHVARCFRSLRGGEEASASLSPLYPAWLLSKSFLYFLRPSFCPSPCFDSAVCSAAIAFNLLHQECSFSAPLFITIIAEEPEKPATTQPFLTSPAL